MSIKGMIQPHFASFLTSENRLLQKRQRAERRRRRQKRPHVVTWYHRAQDPYSHLLAQVLPEFLSKYRVVLVCRTIADPLSELVPFPDLLATHSLRDCLELAPYYGLNMPGHTPTAKESAAANAVLLESETPGQAVFSEKSQTDYLEKALKIGKTLWEGEIVVDRVPAHKQLIANRAELHNRGHYLSGMLYYEGEWYWGIDRLPLLEQRLATLGVGDGSSISRQPVKSTPIDTSSLEVFLSVRSPYSYLAVDRVFDVGRCHSLDVIVKPVLPMVMRGLPVPFKKRMAILQDAKREAGRNQIPFGHICDPLGRGVERVLAVLAHAQTEGMTQQFLTSAMHGIWAEGVEVASNRGLKRVVERGGLDWAKAKAALGDDNWRREAEQNRQELQGLGLWGVPSFRAGDFVTWGQDRLWLLEEKLGLQTTTKAV